MVTAAGPDQGEALRAGRGGRQRGDDAADPGHRLVAELVPKLHGPIVAVEVAAPEAGVDWNASCTAGPAVLVACRVALMKPVWPDDESPPRS